MTSMKKKIKLKPGKSTTFLEPSPGDIIREYYYTETSPKEEIEIGQWLVLGRKPFINEELSDIFKGARLYHCHILRASTNISWNHDSAGQETGIISQRFNSNEWEVVVESGLSWDDHDCDKE